MGDILVGIGLGLPPRVFHLCGPDPVFQVLDVLHQLLLVVQDPVEFTLELSFLLARILCLFPELPDAPVKILHLELQAFRRVPEVVHLPVADPALLGEPVLFELPLPELCALLLVPPFQEKDLPLNVHGLGTGACDPLANRFDVTIELCQLLLPFLQLNGGLFPLLFDRFDLLPDPPDLLFGPLDHVVMPLPFVPGIPDCLLGSCDADRELVDLLPEVLCLVPTHLHKLVFDGLQLLLLHELAVRILPYLSPEQVQVVPVFLLLLLQVGNRRFLVQDLSLQEPGLVLCMFLLDLLILDCIVPFPFQAMEVVSKIVEENIHILEIMHGLLLVPVRPVDVLVEHGDTGNGIQDPPPVDVAHGGDLVDVPLLDKIVAVGGDPGMGEELLKLIELGCPSVDVEIAVVIVLVLLAGGKSDGTGELDLIRVHREDTVRVVEDEGDLAGGCSLPRLPAVEDEMGEPSGADGL